MMASVSLNYLDLILMTFSDLRPVNKHEKRNNHFGDFIFLNMDIQQLWGCRGMLLDESTEWIS
jgi:hypothetical protein